VEALPARTICPPPAVVKHGWVVSDPQHDWLTPPFVSTHWPLVSVDSQAGPVQVALQALPRQLSS